MLRTELLCHEFSFFLRLFMAKNPIGEAEQFYHSPIICVSRINPGRHSPAEVNQ